MNKMLLSSLAVCFALPLSVRADEPAQAVRTGGSAEIERVSNYLLFSSSTKTPIRIPEAISVGEAIRFHYSESGKTIVGSFVVAEISIRGNLCWLHSKRRSQYDSSLGDTIYVQPCRKVQ